MITYKTGAFLPALPVQPVIIQYDENKFNFPVWTWVNPSKMRIIFYTLCQLNNIMEITYLPVYSPSEAEKADVHLYADNVRQKMAKWSIFYYKRNFVKKFVFDRFLGLPIAYHTFEDRQLMFMAQKHNLPLETGLIEFSKIQQKLG